MERCTTNAARDKMWRARLRHGLFDIVKTIRLVRFPRIAAFWHGFLRVPFSRDACPSLNLLLFAHRSCSFWRSNLLASLLHGRNQSGQIISTLVDVNSISILFREQFREAPFSGIDSQASAIDHICDTFFFSPMAINLRHSAELNLVCDFNDFVEESLRLAFPRARVHVSKFRIFREPAVYRADVRELRISSANRF